MPPTYADIEAGYRVYQERVEAGLADAELDAILEGMAEMERAELMPWTALTESFAWAPAALGVGPPFIVGIPVTEVLTCAPLFAGSDPTESLLGGEMDWELLRIDRFIAGGIQQI